MTPTPCEVRLAAVHNPGEKDVSTCQTEHVMTIKPPMSPTSTPPVRSAATVLFSDKTLDHHCLVFSNLAGNAGIQSNQFLVIHKKHAAVIDPGGDLTYTPLTIELS